MHRALGVLLMVAFGTSVQAGSSESGAAPTYTSGSIVNWATSRTGPFAPNSIVTIYGADLAWSEEALGAQSTAAGSLPVELAYSRVLLMNGKTGTPVPLYYAGPKQVNLLLPDSMDPGDIDLCVVRQGVYGPIVRIKVDEVAPALLQRDSEWVRATHADGREITREAPARPGEVVVLYATGLGHPAVKLRDGEIPSLSFGLTALTIARRKELRVLVAGEAVEAGRILYAGLTPGIAGLYQVNVQLPDAASADPEIRLALGESLSPEGLKLPLQPAVSGATFPREPAFN